VTLAGLEPVAEELETLSRLPVSVSSFFDGLSRTLFDGLFVG
jgi:hypothetical protein